MRFGEEGLANFAGPKRGHFLLERQPIQLAPGTVPHEGVDAAFEALEHANRSTGDLTNNVNAVSLRCLELTEYLSPQFGGLAGLAEVESHRCPRLCRKGAQPLKLTRHINVLNGQLKDAPPASSFAEGSQGIGQGEELVEFSEGARHVFAVLGLVE